MRPTWRGSYEASESSCITRAFERYRLLKGGNRIEANIVQVFRQSFSTRKGVAMQEGFPPLLSPLCRDFKRVQGQRFRNCTPISCKLCLTQVLTQDQMQLSGQVRRRDLPLFDATFLFFFSLYRDFGKLQGYHFYDYTPRSRKYFF